MWGGHVVAFCFCFVCLKRRQRILTRFISLNLISNGSFLCHQNRSPKVVLSAYLRTFGQMLDNASFGLKTRGSRMNVRFSISLYVSHMRKSSAHKDLQLPLADAGLLRKAYSATAVVREARTPEKCAGKKRSSSIRSIRCFSRSSNLHVAWGVTTERL